MNIHEYQAKEILRRFGVPVPEGAVAFTREEAEKIARTLKADVFAVKSQIHAGGRGKAGGIKVVKTPEEVLKATRELIGKVLVTHQTGPRGKEVRKVLIEAGSVPKRELYLSILIDRTIGRPSFLASTEGGMDIEAVAAKTPEKILKEPVDPAVGVQPYQARKIAYALGESMRDIHEEDAREVEASKFGLNYIGLDGNIACMVNGAGLAMATMDIIKYYGGSPANFLDVGGGATTEKVTEAFKILVSDKNVKGILVNIFGGIMKCDVIANGILAAVKQVNVNVPLVVRLEGTNVELGKQILKDSGLAIISADSMADAAQKIVQAAK
jgi:succinyl-CoA synthetase beta subunit